MVKLLSCRRRHEEMLHYRAPSTRGTIKGSSKKKGKGATLGLEGKLYEDKVQSENECENHSVDLRNSLGKKGKRTTASVGDGKRHLDDILSEPRKGLTSPRTKASNSNPRKHKQKQKQAGKQSQRQSLTPIQVGLVS